MTWQELRAASEFLGLTPNELWMAYFAVGGSGRPDDVERWLGGETPLPDADHNYLAAALNDLFVERGLGRPIRHTTED